VQSNRRSRRASVLPDRDLLHETLADGENVYAVYAGTEGASL
jgi:hypothetical protein